LFVTSGLARGGAERFLARLATALHASGHTCRVASLGRDEPVAATLRERGIDVAELGPSPLGAGLRLARLARAFEPDVVQGWMYRGNLAACLAARTARRRPALVWSVRQGLGDLDTSPAGTRMTVAWNARWSVRPFAIVYNAYDAARQHEAAGFLAERTRIIANGVDVDALARGDDIRARTRAGLGLLPEHLVVSLFARWHPVKNHRGFAQAAGLFAARRKEARFVLSGHGIDARNERLAAWLDEARVRDRCVLLGDRADVPDLLAASDVVTLASHAEALPNALLEAMGAAVPCVAPAVGDIPELLDDTGIIVRAGDAEALAAGWERLAAMSEGERRALGQKGRARAADRYGIARAASAFDALYAEAISRA
jgi:glycosyltransferase involved in cell wall biosynthesis